MDSEKVAGARELVSRIGRLKDTRHHRHIFQLLRRDGIPYSQNANGPMFNVSKIPEETLEFVRQYLATAEATEAAAAAPKPARGHVKAVVFKTSEPEPEEILASPKRKKCQSAALVKMLKILHSKPAKYKEIAHGKRSEAWLTDDADTNFGIGVGSEVEIGEEPIGPEDDISLMVPEEPTVSEDGSVAEASESEHSDIEDEDEEEPYAVHLETSSEAVTRTRADIPYHLKLTPPEIHEMETDKTVQVYLADLGNLPYLERVVVIMGLLRAGGLPVCDPGVIPQKGGGPAMTASSK